MPEASGSIAYLGAARFQGFWNASTNEASGSGLPDVDTYSWSSGVVNELFATGTSPAGGGYAMKGVVDASGNGLTASAGDYWQVTGSGTHNVDGQTNWNLNDWVIYSGSHGTTDGTWKKLAFEDTIASIIMGDLSASDVFHLSGSNDKHVLFVSGTSDHTVNMSGSNNFIIDYNTGSASNRMRVGIGGATGYGSTNVLNPMNVLQVSHTGGDSDDGILIVRSDSSTADGDLLGGIGFDSTDGNVPSTITEASAYIAAYAAEDHEYGDKGGDLAFGTTTINDNEDTTSHEWMRILDSGKVGIGTTSPSNILQIDHTGVDGDDGIMIVRADTSVADTNLLGGIGFDSTDGNVPSTITEASAYIAAYAAEDHSTGDKGADLVFGTSKIDDDDDTASTEHVRILDSGNVGIGTTTPAAKLDVSGSTKFGRNDGVTTTHQFSGSLYVADNKLLVFGENDDAHIEFDEDQTDYLIISGSALGAVVSGSNVKLDASTGVQLYSPIVTIGQYTATNPILYFVGDSSTGYLQWLEDEDRFALPDDVVLYDDEKFYFGTALESYISYRETGDDFLVISGSTNGVVLSGSAIVLDGATSMSDLTLTGHLSGTTAYFNSNAFVFGNLGVTGSVTTTGAISGSSTLDVVGASNFGPGNQASISPAGILSGSSLATLHGLSVNGTTGPFTVSALGHVSGTSAYIKENTFLYGDLKVTGSITVADNSHVRFGRQTGGAAHIEYNEDGDDYLIISGSTNGVVISGSNVVIDGMLQGASPLVISGSEASASLIISGTCEVTGALSVSGSTIYNYGDYYNYRPNNILQFHIDSSNQRVIVHDDQKLTFGSANESHIEYDGDQTDYLVISGSVQGGIVLSGSTVDVATSMQIKDSNRLYFYDTNAYIYGSGAGTHVYNADGSVYLSGSAGVRIPDDTKLYFGSSAESYIEYNDNGDDFLVISGSTKGVVISGSSVVIDGVLEGASPLVVSDASLIGDLTVADNKKVIFGTSSDAHIEYNEDGDEYLIISGSVTGLVLSGSNLVLDTTTVPDTAVAVADDSIPFFDADGTLKRESVADFATALAGTGLTASGGEISLHFAEISAVTPLASTDSVMILDNGTHTKRVTITTFGDYIVGSNGGLANSSGVLSISGSAIADGTVAVAEDQVIFLDSDGSVKRETIADLVSGMAGTGLDASSGQLTVDLSEVIASDAANQLLTSDGDGTATGEANLTYDGTTFVINDDARINDDLPLYFGTNSDSFIKYRQTGDDYLVISGSTKGIVLSGSNIVIDGLLQGASPLQLGDVNLTGDLTVSGHYSGSTSYVNSNSFVYGNLEVTGSVTTTGAISGSSTLNIEGVSNFGPGNLTSISAAGEISGSGDSTIHKITMNRLVAATADIDGGTIDGTTIGASSQSSVKATTLSGSDNLNVVGVSTFGAANYASISSAGVISGSGDSTIHTITADQLHVKGPAVVGTYQAPSMNVSGQTIPAISLLNGTWTAMNRGSGQTDTTDTAANIVSAILNPVMGDAFEFLYLNVSSNTVTLAGGTEVTMMNAATGSYDIGAGQGRAFKFIIKNAAGGSQAVTIVPTAAAFNLNS